MLWNVISFLIRLLVAILALKITDYTSVRLNPVMSAWIFISIYCTACSANGSSTNVSKNEA